MFFFSKEGIPARTLFIIYINKIFDAEYLVFDDRRYITVRWCCHTLARLTMADHSCSNRCSMERVGKVENAAKAKKCNTTCDL